MGIENRVSEDIEQFYNYAIDNVERYGLEEKPFEYTDDMIRKCWELMVDKSNYRSLYNADSVRDWIHNNVRPYDDVRNAHYRSASETFEDMIGECVDRSFLLITMNNLMGIDAGFVSVIKSYEGRNIPHVCTYAKDPDEGFVLIDPAMYGYDPKHQQYAVYDKETAIRFYETYCMAFNRRDEESFSRYMNEFDVLDRRLAGIREPIFTPNMNYGQQYGGNNYHQRETPFIFTNAGMVISSIAITIGIRVFLPNLFFGFSEAAQHLFNVKF